jgi:putative N6-adenine-specific DNA methylase
MKGLVITHKGAERFSVDEITELVSAKIISVGNGLIVFEVTDFNDLKKLAFYGQSFLRVLELLDEFVDDEIIKSLETKVSFLKIDCSFRVRCTRKGDHNFISSDIESKMGGIIFKANPNSSVELKNPEKVIHIYIFDNKCYICNDLCVYDLSKRDYKIFVHPASIKGTLAYLLLKVADYKKNKIILDPFCGSGTILIEAALYVNNISPHHFSKNRFYFDQDEMKKIKISYKDIYGYDFLLKNIIAARKNAKIAGVEDSIHFSKIEVSWLDTKFEENLIDIIVTDPPKLSKQLIEKDFTKLMNELFYQSKYLIKKNGSIVILTNQKSLDIISQSSEKYDFKIDLKIELDLGTEDLIMLRFIKN